MCGATEEPALEVAAARDADDDSLVHHGWDHTSLHQDRGQAPGNFLIAFAQPRESQEALSAAINPIMPDLSEGCLNQVALRTLALQSVPAVRLA